MKTQSPTVCVVAIVKDELPFLDEWLCYHRLIGTDHFILYDDDPAYPLAKFLEPHQDYVSIVPWHDLHMDQAGRNRQTKAYQHASKNFLKAYDWVIFIDIDEFVVLRSHLSMKDFLLHFDGIDAISLNWHVFGHNGYFEDPEDLITLSLTRRKLQPSVNVKTFTRTKAIGAITTAHFCRMQQGTRRTDANKRPYADSLYPGKTAKAHINHYQSRSFSRWMDRISRGDVTIDGPDHINKDNTWRIDYDTCLRQFITTVALDKNEHIDTFMNKYEQELRLLISGIKR